MAELGYDGVSVRVRDDLVDAHRRAWQRLARPGTWWTGAERVGIAAEVRAAWTCALCARRKEALSPSHADGEHDQASALPAAAVEAVHRVVTDPGRLSKPWFDELIATGLSEGHYVELIGVTVTVVSIDRFCRGLGAPLHPLPEPQSGEPSRYRPATAVSDGAWVPMIPQRNVSGAEAGLYGELPRTGNVIRAMSLVPDEVRQLRALGAVHYLSERQMIDLTAGRTIDRAQIELIAGRVSSRRECFY